MSGLLHLTSGESAGGAVLAGLRQLGIRDEVLCAYDDLSVGPLRDVDRGGAGRVAWWERIDASLSVLDRKRLDDRESWRRVLADDRDVVLWYGPHTQDVLCALRACWWLRRTPRRVHEVRLRIPGGVFDQYFGAVALANPSETAAAVRTARRVRDVAARAARWVRIRSGPDNAMRALARWRIVSHPVTFRDAEIVAACRDGFSSSTTVLGTVIGRGPPVSDAVIRWRVLELLAAGVLEGRGRRTRFGLPEEVRASQSSAESS